MSGNASFEILLVEDDPADVRLIQVALQRSRIPHALGVVMDGEAALRYLRREGGYANRRRPDLMLLDLYLPGRDGLSILREMREDEALRRIPVVVITGMAQANTDYGRLSHAVRCVPKPSDGLSVGGVIQEIEDIWLQISHRAPYLGASSRRT